ncbi:hypothetical protein GGI03_001384 [Coemansia sp. RSA 2337]|nr:hypothetical protein GGI09_003399 [Coemansia sp. S100]KAJ2352589.1 hypothetical protein GGH92_001171 [Coemansia sp. RSA 2673]KAJ2467765.1 hypothetical protein GGI03_001384 [Coemansia sp. RSA 2337]
MSRAAKATFTASCLYAVGTIWAQDQERASMYQGVVRDQERRAQREQNKREYDETRALHAELIKEQPDINEIKDK